MGFGGAGAAGVSGRMGEQGGLRTGWLAAFGTEGYEGEPPLLEELGVNFGHIKGKVFSPTPLFPHRLILHASSKGRGEKKAIMLYTTQSSTRPSPKTC